MPDRFQLAFIIPLATKPDQCANAITPNDMHSDASCAWAGALLLGGGWWAIVWGTLRPPCSSQPSSLTPSGTAVFLMSFSLHLQVCWHKVTGRKFFIFAQLLGWGVPVIILTETLYFSGVSYRFGTTCQSNHGQSLAGFWIPALTFGGVTLVIQFITYADAWHDATTGLTWPQHRLLR